VRIHPAIIAQAAATAAAMMPGRFFLGVGTGENLNEHITGERWPAFDIRLEMLKEAIEIIRLLWEGGEKSHYGKYYTVENARLYTLPDETPKLMVAGSGSKSANAAGRYGDGLVNTAPVSDVIETFEEAGGKDKPRYAQVTLCWDESEEKALDVLYKHWPTSGITGELKQELPTPTHFEQAVKMVTKEDLAEKLVLGPDPERHRAGIQKFIDAGYDHVYIHQVGPNQAGFFRFYQREILPKFQ
jgi:G6PDH family F420-dependent oxidoreductase